MTTSLTERPAKWYDSGHGALTPWGPADVRYDYAPGIACYSTPGHGGFKVNAELNLLIPGYMNRVDGWYEEDCDWAIVATCFPSAFTVDERKHAEAALRNWYPNAWERFNGRLLEPGESSTKDEQARIAKTVAEGRYLPITAWGDWCDTVPPGMVGVKCRLGGHDGEGPQISVLIPHDEYRTDEGILPGQYPVWIGPFG
jgi:hypothetical protein